MKKIILAILLIAYTHKALCIVIDWDRVNQVFPKVELEDLNEYIYSIWNQDIYFDSKELVVYDTQCSMPNIHVYLYMEPIGQSHSDGYFILQDSSGYKNLPLIEILDKVLNNKKKKLIDSKLVFYSTLASIVDRNSMICVKRNESKYIYNRHGYSQLLKNHYYSLESNESHCSVINQWVTDNFGMQCEYSLIPLYSHRRKESCLIKINSENTSKYCLYTGMKTNLFYYVDDGTDATYIDTILLSLAENVIAQSKMSKSQKINYIKKTQEALLNINVSSSDMR